MLNRLWNDEFGFIISAELVLVATILVVGLVVGMSEVPHAVVQELNDVGDAIGSLNQSYGYSGFSAKKSNGKLKSFFVGSRFSDKTDDCDDNQCDLACDPARPEQPKGHH
ncbi:MAG: hypothetical protein WEB58_19450 [Planctomycetaceae bacterium]